MSEILADLWKSLRRLSRTQWIIVAGLSFVIGTGLFFVFEWIYERTYEAQDRVVEAQKILIDVKDQTIQYYAGENLPGSTQIAHNDVSDIAPNGWDPYVEQAFDFLRSELTEGEAGQQGMNRTSADMGFILDAALFIRYVRVYEQLPPSQRAGLREEQSSWIADRSRESESAVESHGGSLAPLEYNLKFVEITQARIAEFDGRLAAAKN